MCMCLGLCAGVKYLHIHMDVVFTDLVDDIFRLIAG